MALTDKQDKALNYFMKGYTKKEAVKLAGYGPSAYDDPYKVFGSQAMKDAIERRKKRLAERADVDADWIISKLVNIAEADLGDIIEIDEEGMPRLDYSKMSPALRAAITGLSVEEFSEGRGKDRKPYTKIKIQKADQLRALELIGKMLGLFKDTLKIEGDEAVIAALHQGRKRVAKDKPEEDDG